MGYYVDKLLQHPASLRVCEFIKVCMLLYLCSIVWDVRKVDRVQLLQDTVLELAKPVCPQNIL